MYSLYLLQMIIILYHLINMTWVSIPNLFQALSSALSHDVEIDLKKTSVGQAIKKCS